jgi:glycerol-3-phosphate acyltransferase PlsY
VDGFVLHPAVALVASYVVGSFPSAWIAGKASGVNLREHGSGNLGATNVLRVLGPRIGAAVFLADIAKGVVPTFYFPGLTGLAGNALVILQMLCGAAAIMGHARPVFLGFGKGGKGVATSCGVFLAIAPLQTAFTLLTFTAVVLASGFVSLASLTAAFALPVVLGASYGVASIVFPVGIVAMLFVAYTHRENIKRLRAGSEFRFEKSLKLGLPTSLAIGMVVIAGAATFLLMRAR